MKAQVKPGRPRVYPFPSMSVGAQFYVGTANAKSATVSARSFGLKTRRKFESQSVEGGICIRRVK